MAVEKGKVIPVLTEAVKGKGYSKTFIEKMATKLAEKIEDDDSIQSYIDDRLDILIEADAEADRRATLAVDKFKKPEPEPKPDVLPDDTPEWAKTLVEQHKALTEKLAGFEQQNIAKTIEHRFRADERLKGIPEFVLKGRIPKSEDELDAAVEDIVNDWKSFTPANVGNDNPPANYTVNKTTGKKEASDSDLDRIAAKIK